MSAPNRNILWARIFVDELARSGLKVVCIAPGSRSTPLTLAFAEHDSITVYSHLDERSAAFFALGLALASDAPVALVCTSGTATANFYPAIVEAHQSRIPLLILTSDRPHELRHSGANQTIDQIKMYGDFILWSVDAALPEENPPAIAIRNLRTLAGRAYAKANGSRKGVVQINLPFRKPLEPIPVETDNTQIPIGAEARANGAAFTIFQTAHVAPSNAQISTLSKIIAEHERGLIVCGVGCPDGAFVKSLNRLSQLSGYPVLADAVSNVRFGDETSIGGYETFLMNGSPIEQSPQVVIRFGAVPTSKWLNQYLATIAPEFHIHIKHDGEWSDDSHLTTHFMQCDETRLIQALCETLTLKRQNTVWREQFCNAEQATWRIMDDAIENSAFFDGAAVYEVVDLIPDDSLLFVGNSLPVRHLDQFGKPTQKRIRAYANRGASGIDGNISTALGIGAAYPDKPLVFIVGDVTFYHDMNGLLAVNRCGIPVTIVLLNNNGGGIFHRLPIKDFDPPFTDLFVTPHGLEFEHTARLYGLDYVRADNRNTFREAFSESVTNRLSRIIEIHTDAQNDLRRRNEIVESVKRALRGI
jgi:2-succinyl-5-enolpyruvyl-6-hydroxy-3-cyclohexene-1-carboxylate synthase